MARCRVCSESVWSSARSTIAVPSELSGEVACDWCRSSLQALADGTIQRGAYAQLADYALKDEALSAIIGSLWERLMAGELSRRAATAERVAVLEAMPTTSGFGFEGSSIVRYLGFRSAEVVMGMGVFRAIGADFSDFFGTESNSLNKKLGEAKEAAFRKLRTEVSEAGGNAIIGVDLDYTMFGASIVGVIASGTAVVIEPRDG